MGFSLTDMDAVPIPTKRWARVEYERLVDRAVVQPGERVELVGGQLVVREPQRSPHAVAVQLAEDALRAAFGPCWVVRVQMPVALDDESEPEPDVAVCAGSPRDYGEPVAFHRVLAWMSWTRALVWDSHRRVRREALPEKPLVVRIELTDMRGAARRHYLLLRRSEVSLCLTNPGFPEELCLRADRRTMIGWWGGDLTFRQAFGAGLILEGQREWVCAFPS